MPRPQKCRLVCNEPNNNRFGPRDKKGRCEVVQMTVDEYECIRLIDLEGFTQEECAKHMNVARTTVQSIYNNARVKLAEVVVNGKNLTIGGGEYRLCSGQNASCGRQKCRGIQRDQEKEK